MIETALLTLNAGSSSIKFAVFDGGAEPVERLRGQVENLGPAARLSIDVPGAQRQRLDLGAADHGVALSAILEQTRSHIGAADVTGVGHRIVHGGIDFTSPTVLDDSVIAKLRALEPLAPLHQPHNLAAVEAARRVFPEAVQIGCFDTAFHRNQPWVSDTFGLPRSYFDKGVRRYGFHGLSYDYITGHLVNVAPDIADGRVIIAHLGNGASMCAVTAGRSVASTMGFSALDGLPMGTRCGQLDPGVMLYLLDEERLTSAQIADLLYKQSGLKGLSGLTNDMRALEESDNPAAAEAIDYFVFRIRREVGALAAVLGGLDALVFTGGIGENSRTVRAKVCEGMDWLGIGVDASANTANAMAIGTGRVQVLVIPTDEERIIARALVAELSS